MPSRKARPEISRLGEDGCDLCGRKHRQSHPHRRERIVQGAGALDASRNRKQEPAADAGLSRNARGRLIYQAVGEGRTPRRRIPRIQGRAHRLRRVRRGNQLPPGSFARRTRVVPCLRWRKVLYTGVGVLSPPDAIVSKFLLTSLVTIEVSAQCTAVAWSLTTY